MPRGPLQKPVTGVQEYSKYTSLLGLRHKPYKWRSKVDGVSERDFFFCIILPLFSPFLSLSQVSVDS